MAGRVLSKASILALAGSVAAFWRMECHSPIGLARLDPLVEPGQVADHAHTIHGGRNFGMEVSTKSLLDSSCTSCRVTQDFSVYWTPSLHFVFPNGTSTVVPQVGGMLAYYLLYGENLKAFPKDFRILAGDALQRNFSWPEPDPPKPWFGEEAEQFALSQKALGFNCLNYARNPPEATLYRHRMPEKSYLDENCLNGIRMELMFPSCWNGVDLDTADHKSHTAYPSMTIDGTCPEGFNTRVPSLLYETIWNTYAFKGIEGEFVLSNGDPTGCGYHGDFIAGWDENLLQSAVDTCTNPSGKIEDCPVFNLQTEQEAVTCKMDIPAELDGDDCVGPRDGLPGNVPIQAGPERATKGSSAASAPAYTPPPSPIQPPVPSYHAGTKPVTDSYGGGITVAKVNDGMAMAPAPTPEAEEPEVLSAPAPTPEPEVSSAPVEDGPEGVIIATSTYTSAGAVYEVVYEEVQMTVTADVPAASPHKHKRHNHHKRNGHF